MQTETSPSQNNRNWSSQRKYVMVILNHPGTSGGERVWAISPVCLLLHPFCFKLDLFRICLAKTKFYTCNKIVFYRLNNIRLKGTNCACAFKRELPHLNRPLGPYTKDIFRSFGSDIGFCSVYNKGDKIPAYQTLECSTSG